MKNPVSLVLKTDKICKNAQKALKTTKKNVKNSEKLELQIVLGASALLERYGPVIDIINPICISHQERKNTLFLEN